ncbi:MAG: hypothetical protein PHN35_05335 [Clostridia bacterium]|nr:hypothetical protein [Clostridia bacterium]MDD4798878.1 hypothetical protein [Clostridia bacterium]
MNEEMAKQNVVPNQLTRINCNTGANPNCAECCNIFTNTEKRAAFGYQAESAACECHDICVQDVRDICVKNRLLRVCVPCTPNGRPGCRGGFLPDDAPEVQNIRISCAEENISPETYCDRIKNEVEFEVVLRYGSGTLAVLTPKDTFDCMWFEFARFPSGEFYAKSYTGKEQFRERLTVIDGSCKVIIIEDYQIIADGNDCVLEIAYKVIDKLWKRENLLVTAIKPYVGIEIENTTVCQTFNQGHQIGPCNGSGPCGGI